MFNTAFAASGNAAGTSEVASETASELTKFVQVIITKIPLFIVAIIVIVLTFLFAKIARNIVENKLAEKGIEEEHKELQILGGRITSSAIQVIGITAGLKIAGIDLTSIIAAAAFGVGFALKDLIMNFLAGVMILLGRHFSIGDFIKIGSTLGKVVEIQSRVTILQAIDGTKVIVPNADLFKKQVTSFTSNPLRRIEIVVRIDFRNSLENAIKISNHVLTNTKGVLDQPKPAVLVGEFGESAIQLKLRAWVNSRGGWLKVKSNLIKNVKKEFDTYGIRIPWPIKTMVKDEELEFNERLFEEEQKKEKEIQESQTQIAGQAMIAQPVLVPATETPGNVSPVNQEIVLNDQIQQSPSPSESQSGPTTNSDGQIKPL